MTLTFYAGEAYRHREKGLLAPVLPSWWKPWEYLYPSPSHRSPLPLLTRSEIQSHPFWSPLVEEIEQETNSILFEKGRQRKRIKKLVSRAFLDAPGGLEHLDDTSGDLAAMLEYFRTKPKRSWEMRQVALALVVLYMGIWNKALAAREPLLPHEIDTGLFLDRIAMAIEQRRQQQNRSILQSLIGLVIETGVRLVLGNGGSMSSIEEGAAFPFEDASSFDADIE